MQQKILYLGLAVLAAIIAYAFVLIGSPGHNRAVLADKAKLQDLTSLHCALRVYHKTKSDLPQDMKTLEAFIEEGPDRASRNDCDWCSIGRDIQFNAPEGTPLYEYKPGIGSYTICTDFKTSWEDLKKNKWGDEYNDYKDFKQGKFCFERNLPACKKKGNT